MSLSRRIPSGTFATLGPVNWALSKIGAKAIDAGEMNLFSTLGQAKRLFPAWLVYSGLMMPAGILSRTETELIILRVSHLRGSAYERGHHERIGARVGLSPQQIENTTLDVAQARWPRRHEVLLTAVDEMVKTRDICDETWTSVAEMLNYSEQVALVQLIAQYDSLATVLHTLRIPADPPRH